MLGLGWLPLIGNHSALLLYSKVQKIKPSLFWFNINVPGMSYNFSFPTLMILQLMDCETSHNRCQQWRLHTMGLLPQPTEDYHHTYHLLVYLLKRLIA